MTRCSPSSPTGTRAVRRRLARVQTWGAPIWGTARADAHLLPFGVMEKVKAVSRVASSADGSRAGGGGLGPRHGIPEAARQAVLDAAAVLQVRRSETAALLAQRPLPD